MWESVLAEKRAGRQLLDCVPEEAPQILGFLTAYLNFALAAPSLWQIKKRPSLRMTDKVGKQHEYQDCVQQT